MRQNMRTNGIYAGCQSYIEIQGNDGTLIKTVMLSGKSGIKQNQKKYIQICDYLHPKTESKAFEEFLQS